MQPLFSKNQIIQNSIGPYTSYCVGHPGQGGYFITLSLSIGIFPKTFSYYGSQVLDMILAYDKAETEEAFLGQINMSIVSSFVGPEGLIWGYDVAKEETVVPPGLSFLNTESLESMKGIVIKNGENLRKAAKLLFGTKERLHFPFLPGSHVPTAGRFRIEEGPIYLYSAAAIGIPKERNRAACLLMEDVGKFEEYSHLEEIKHKVMKSDIESILEVGKNQNVEYKEIFIDFIHKKIEIGEIGCAWVFMPYFRLARGAVTKNLTTQTINEWGEESQKYFLENQN